MPKKNTRRLLLIPLLIVLGIVVVYAARYGYGYYLKRSPDYVRSHTKTYTNTKYGFSLRYPSGFELLDWEAGKNNATTVVQIQRQIPNSQALGSVNVMIVSNEKCDTGLSGERATYNPKGGIERYNHAHGNDCYIVEETEGILASPGKEPFISESEYNTLKEELDPIVASFSFTK